jgi:hypothetical protein
MAMNYGTATARCVRAMTLILAADSEGSTGLAEGDDDFGRKMPKKS